MTEAHGIEPDARLHRRLYLVGMMGSGKSYWCSRLAAHFGCEALDLDALIEAKSGKTVAQIFAEGGEAAFRIWESQGLRTSGAHQAFVMATGGGTPCFQNNMDFMLTTGWVLWMNPPMPQLLKRLIESPVERPLIAEARGNAELLAARLQTLLERRQPYYQRAHAQVAAPAPTLQHILDALKPLQGLG
jgi:shikimate kinase